jgi:hypothetical protein
MARRSTPPVSKLLIKNEQGGDREILLNGQELTIGRDPTNSLCLAEDRLTSRFHARLYREGDAWMVVDEGSTNGTFLGRTRLREAAVVTPGVKIRLGRTTLILQVEGAAPPEAAPEKPPAAETEPARFATGGEGLAELARIPIPSRAVTPPPEPEFEADLPAWEPPADLEEAPEIIAEAPALVTEPAPAAVPELTPGSAAVEAEEAVVEPAGEAQPAEPELFSTSWSLDEDNDTSGEAWAGDTETGGSDDMIGCTVCEAFPDHQGQHYNYRNLNMRLLGMRMRMKTSGQEAWIPIPDCTSAEGYPLLVSVRLPDNPDAIGANGLWFIAQSPEFERVEAELRAQEAGFAAEEAQGAPAAPVAEAPVATPPLEEAPAVDEEDTLSALRRAATERAARMEQVTEPAEETPEPEEAPLEAWDEEATARLAEWVAAVPVEEVAPAEAEAAADPLGAYDEPLLVEEELLVRVEEIGTEEPIPEVEAPVEEAPAVEEAAPEAEAEVPEEEPPAPMEGPPPATPEEVRALHAEKLTPGVRAACLFWGATGLELDLRPLTAPDEAPSVEQLRAALRGFQVPEGIRISIAETLGQADAMVELSTLAGGQSALLTAAGRVVEALLAAGIYGECLIAPSPGETAPPQG